jgi:Ca2+-binding RTX toxin-like protein
MSGSLILTPVDGAATDFFGYSVSLSADGLTAIVGGYGDGDTVGVNFDQGSARVFDWTGNAWVQRGGALTPTDGATYDFFGCSVSLSDDGLTAIVGGYWDDVGANTNQGSARVFTWNGSAWVQRGGAITPSDGAADDLFGGSVSLSADGLTAIVGGWRDDVGANVNQGSARVFDWTGGAWVQRGGALTSSNGAANDFFGSSVSMSADGLTAIVGSAYEDVGANADVGSARVFDWSGSAWVQRGGVLPGDGATYDYFGSSVSLSADGFAAIVGGALDDVGANSDQGSARVFDWTGNAWVQRGGALTSSDGAADDFFGYSVSLSADGLTAIVGSYGDDVGANTNQGSARVFTWTGSAWVQRGGALTPSDGAANDYFGFSVSLSADGLTAILGGFQDQVGANSDQGSARVFAWDGSAWLEGAPASAVLIAATSASKAEGNTGTTSYSFTVTRTGDTSTAQTVDWAVTGSGTNAAAAADFVGNALPTGTVSFAIGESSKTITIDVAADSSVETDEDFTVTLSNASAGLVLGTSTATGTIINDDASVSIAGTSASKAEGNAGTTSYTFTATRTGDTSTAQTAAWAVTGSGTNAAAAADFVGAALPSGTVSFAIGESSKTITIDVAGDASVETDEGFTVTLSNPSTGLVLGTSTATGAIINDDASVSIAGTSASKAEGNAGTTSYTFTATRTGDTSTAQTAAWAVTGSGTNAAVAADFVGAALPSGTVSFAIGESSKTITVAVAGETQVEADEGFTVTLSNPSAGLVLGTASATGAIINDDVAAPTNGADTLTGTTNADTLNGLGGNDSLTGLAGNDLLDGGTGADTLTGGVGDDTYVVDNTLDRVIELSGGGVDLVQSSITHTLGAEVENLTLTGTAAISGTGNALGNQITGNSAANTLNGGTGADTLTGGSGNDTLLGGTENDLLDGGTGADSMVGGTGNDTYVVDSTLDRVIEAASGGTDLVQSSITYTLGTEVENLTLTGTAAINGTGNALANQITGNTGANTLNGGTGADTLTGGVGNDTYVVDNLGDRVIELSGGGVDLVQSSITYTLGTEVENLTLTGSTAINGTGNALANQITGNTGANTLNGDAGADTLTGGSGNDRLLGGTENDWLDGGTGADTLEGGVGDDTYVVDNTTDRVIELSGGGTDLVRSSITHTLAVQVENLTLTGSTAINGTGNALANQLTGNSGANTLDGGTGADTLTGGLGADRFQLRATTDSGVTSTSWDVIADFTRSQSDRIDLSLMDAVSSTTTNDAFSFIGTAAFSGTNAAGQLRTVYDASLGGVIVYGSVDANNSPEFALLVRGVTSLQASDFIL